MRNKDKAKIGDYAARIRRATARLDRLVAKWGARIVASGQMDVAPYEARIDIAAGKVTDAIQRACKPYVTVARVPPVIRGAVRDGNAAITRAYPLIMGFYNNPRPA